MGEDIRGRGAGSFDLVVFLWSKRRFLLGITLLGLVIGVIAAYVIRPLYKSEVILFPAVTNSVSRALLMEGGGGREDILALGDEEDAEQLLQILQSDMVRDRAAERFKLMEAYHIQEDSPHKNSQMHDAYDDHVRFEYTKYGSISVQVTDEEPQRAADIANFIAEQVDSVWRDMVSERAMKGVALVQVQVDALQREMMLVDDSMRTLRGLGVQEYHTQAERFNEYMGAAIVKGDQRAVRELEERFKGLAQYGGGYVVLQERLYDQGKRMDILRMKLAQAQAEAANDLPHKFVVNKAYPADRKSSPVRWLVIATSTISALFLALLLIVVQENLRRIRSGHA